MNFRRFLSMALVLVLVFGLVACGNNDTEDTNGQESEENVETSNENVLRVGMECAYAPYNWSQSDDSNGAVPIEGTNEFANGYDVEMAKKVADAMGKELVVVKTAWKGLPPAVQSGKIDLIMAGMSPTEDRKENIDFSAPYWESDLIMILRKDSEYADATSINDFEGAKITGQINTVHYTVLDQMEGIEKVDPMTDFTQMRVALETGKIDGYVAETPEGISVEMAMENLTYITFDEENGFKTDPTERQIAAGLKKGSDIIDSVSEVFESVTEEERAALMEEAIANQPISQ